MNLKYLPYAFTRRAIPIWLIIAVILPVASYLGVWLGEKNRQARLAKPQDYAWALQQCVAPISGYDEQSCACIVDELRERELEKVSLQQFVDVGFRNQPTGSINLVTDIMRLGLGCGADSEGPGD